MRWLLHGAIMMVVTIGLLGACGVKSPPKYTPDAPAAETKKS